MDFLSCLMTALSLSFCKHLICNRNKTSYYNCIYTEERGVCKHNFVALCITGSISSYSVPISYRYVPEL